MKGLQLGQDVQKIDTEVKPIYMLTLLETCLISFSMGIIFVTRKDENKTLRQNEYIFFRGENFSVMALFCWMISASIFHLIGAIIGVSLLTRLFCIKTILGMGE